jgi:hypothetical protein
VAALLRNIGSVTGRDPSDGRDAAREKAAEILAELADHVGAGSGCRRPRAAARVRRERHAQRRLGAS